MQAVGPIVAPGPAASGAAAAGWVMQNGLYVSLSAQVSLERRLETVANNVANMNTVGFRGDGVHFSAELAKAGDSRLPTSRPETSYISRDAGASVKTDNPFDVAIQGDGWMAIRTQSGIAYTRDGRMRMSESGALETLIGNPVLDAGGAPIVLNPVGSTPNIGGDGMISQDGRQVGAIGLFSIDPQANLAAPRTPASSPTSRRRRSSISPRTAWRRASSKARTSTRSRK